MPCLAVLKYRPVPQDDMPKMRKPKSGWPRLPDPRKRGRRWFRERNAGVGLPPCPACNRFAMKKDDTRGEVYCTECGCILGR